MEPTTWYGAANNRIVAISRSQCTWDQSSSLHLPSSTMGLRFQDAHFDLATNIDSGKMEKWAKCHGSAPRDAAKLAFCRSCRLGQKQPSTSVRTGAVERSHQKEDVVMHCQNAGTCSSLDGQEVGDHRSRTPVGGLARRVVERSD